MSRKIGRLGPGGLIWRPIPPQVFLAALLAVTATAQQPRPQAPAGIVADPTKPLVDGTVTSPGEVDPAIYVIRSNDVLSINISGEKFSINYPVRADGTIMVPPVGRIEAQGLTLVQLQTELATKLSEQKHDPRVTV